MPGSGEDGFVEWRCEGVKIYEALGGGQASSVVPFAGVP